MNISKLREQLCVDYEKFQNSLRCIGIQNEDETRILTFNEAQILCFEYTARLIPEEWVNHQFPNRPPIITIMGHVDHGKTTLLDSLRNSQLAEKEFGGITQKIGAFHNISPDGQKITYIDTPGHEAFTNMRRRGAQSTDLIVLVVSAVDGIQQQTLEVIEIARECKVPMIVAINKIDVPGASTEEIEKELYEKGQLDLECFGGNIPTIHISAKFNKNIDLLEELILFEIDLLDLRENEQCLSEGMVLESRKSEDGDG